MQGGDYVEISLLAFAAVVKTNSRYINLPVKKKKLFTVQFSLPPPPLLQKNGWESLDIPGTLGDVVRRRGLHLDREPAEMITITHMYAFSISVRKSQDATYKLRGETDGERAC